MRNLTKMELDDIHKKNGWDCVWENFDIYLLDDKPVACIRGMIEGEKPFLQGVNVFSVEIHNEFRPAEDSRILVLGCDATTRAWNRLGALEISTDGLVCFFGDNRPGIDSWHFCGSWPVG